MLYCQMIDPYLDDTSGILRNKFGISDQRSLDITEANAVSVRSVFLQLNPIAGNFDSDHLKAIHRYLFQDVYDWAGEFRKIELAKRDVSGGNVTRFTAPQLIETELRLVFEKLVENKFLCGQSRKVFATNIAELFCEINRIHPFREGNGRAQRQFVRYLAAGNGFKLHFEVVSKERLIQSSISSAHGDFAMMKRMFDEVTDTERIQSLIGVIDHLRRNGFDWNSVYVATTTPGQRYSGLFAGSAGADFFFRDEADRIIVGKVKDLHSTPDAGDKIDFTAS